MTNEDSELGSVLHVEEAQVLLSEAAAGDAPRLVTVPIWALVQVIDHLTVFDLTFHARRLSGLFLARNARCLFRDPDAVVVSVPSDRLRDLLVLSHQACGHQKSGFIVFDGDPTSQQAADDRLILPMLEVLWDVICDGANDDPPAPTVDLPVSIVRVIVRHLDRYDRTVEVAAHVGNIRSILALVDSGMMRCELRTAHRLYELSSRATRAQRSGHMLFDGQGSATGRSGDA